MAVDDKNVIDLVSINPEGKAVLTISDHLEWNIENGHLLILQDKINSYVDVIVSGQLYESYPEAKNRDFVIQLVMKYLPNEDGRKFLDIINKFLEDNGYEFNFYQLDKD